MLKLLVIFGALTVINCQDCRNEWTAQQQCMTKDRQQFTTSSQLTDQERSEIKQKLRQCYNEEHCNDPFPADHDDDARKQCFVKVKEHLLNDLQNCAYGKNFHDYDTPKGNNGDKDWGQYIVHMKKANCQPQDKKRFSLCMGNAMQRFRSNGNNQQQQHQNRPDPCEVRYQCYQHGGTSQRCFDRRRDLTKALCDCVSGMDIGKFKQEYQRCMQSSNLNVDTNNDFNYASFDKIKDKYCKQTQDPCGGYSGRHGFGGPQSNNNGGGNGNNQGGNPNWQQGSNNQGGNPNWQQGGNQGGNPNFPQGGNNQGGNFQQGNSGGQDVSNYDLSSVGGDDDGFPPVGNVIGSSGTSTGTTGPTDLSSLISSSNTGFDPSSFLGGGLGSTGTSPLGGGLLSSLGGGGLGSLGGGGLGTGGGLSSLGGGGLGTGGGLSSLGSGGGLFSNFDPSTIFSGLGGKKK